MTLAYYAKERASVAASYPELVAAPCEFADAKILIEWLAKEHHVVITSIEPTSGRNRSTWTSRTKTIRLNDKTGWRTAIHEFCHAFDEKFRPNSARWHDMEFLDLVLDFCRIVTQRGWHLSIPVDRKAANELESRRQADREAARAVRDAIESNPYNIRTKKIEKRRAQIRRLETRIKSLTTRLNSARRSLAALERAAEKKADAASLGNEATSNRKENNS